MKVYSLTKLGEQVAVKSNGNGDELKILRYMYANRRQPITDSELSNVDSDSKFMVNGLKRQGLVVELTSG
jgi:hypothetical protein